MSLYEYSVRNPHPRPLPPASGLLPVSMANLIETKVGVLIFSVYSSLCNNRAILRRLAKVSNTDLIESKGRCGSKPMIKPAVRIGHGRERTLHSAVLPLTRLYILYRLIIIHARRNFNIFHGPSSRLCETFTALCSDPWTSVHCYYYLSDRLFHASGNHG